MDVAIEWTPARRDTLRAFCDTMFGSVAVDHDRHGFWARQASDFGVERAAAEALDSPRHAAERTGLVALLDALAGRLTGALGEREAVIHEMAAGSDAAAARVARLGHIVLGLAYGLTGADGNNPNWPAIGYPCPAAPLAPRAAIARPIQPLAIHRDQVIDTDVCVIGAGAGGSVIAAELTRRGRGVLVVEAGGYFHAEDFAPGELWGLEHLCWRGGHTPTADGHVTLLAGNALGGATLIDGQRCLRTPPWVRREWATQHGLDGVDGAAFDRAMDLVLARLRANDRCSERNGPHQRLEAGARALGYRVRITQRSVDPDRHDPALAGHGFGDRDGGRQSAVTAYLTEAHHAGARIVVRAAAERIVVEAGRVTGVEAVAIGPDGAAHRLVIRARHVVVACGALETPALLLRSALGGPATGRYLHLHPTLPLAGIYGGDLRAWWGPAQTAMVDELLQISGDHGFLIECGHHGPATAAATLPWCSALEHKVAMTYVPNTAVFVAALRDHGHGRVTLDDTGAAAVRYAVTDPRDVAMLRRATHEMARLHDAAGAWHIAATVAGASVSWRRGEPLDSFVDRLQPYGAGGYGLHSAHQMSSARMGRDPHASVAGPTGELHDTRGVWIGDTSAFPTAPGVHPMITCMALAMRTAEHIADAP